MVLEGYRGWSAPYLERLARPFLRVPPAKLSWVSLGLSALAGVLAAVSRWTTPILFLAVAAGVFASGVFDVLDGEVARRTGRAGPKGDLLDHVLDRYADLFVLVGIAVSGYAYPPL
ncbi:MAG TPA: CDP-alcohol phosphatidyltransferase family protein, partial [Thermoplasmata archaeon]|nr:CDP-alcohol phosphatidyltransferase family protein [Thermoplasmata archaeon]